MENVLISASTIIAIVLALTTLLKTMTPTNTKWLPLINLITGIVVGILWGISFDSVNIINYGWGGLIAGLATGGFYDLNLITKKGGK